MDRGESGRGGTADRAEIDARGPEADCATDPRQRPPRHARRAGGGNAQGDRGCVSRRPGRRVFSQGAVDGFDLYEEHSVAHASHPISAFLGRFSAGSNERSQMVNSHGQFVWYELMTTDVAAAKAFYAEVVGWRARDVSLTDAAFALCSTGDGPVSGLM